MRGQATDLGTNWFLTRNLNFGREYLEKVQKITLDDIKRVAIQCLSEENLTIVSLNPKGSLTSTSDVAAAAATGEIQKFELSNGLRILVREDARLPLIAMSAIFRCGLLCETEANNGITRIAAKTLLKGTKTRSAEQIADQLEAAGGDAGIGFASEFKRSSRFSRSLRRGAERRYRRIWRRKSYRSERFI